MNSAFSPWASKAQKWCSLKKLSILTFLSSTLSKTILIWKLKDYPCQKNIAFFWWNFKFNFLNKVHFYSDFYIAVYNLGSFRCAKIFLDKILFWKRLSLTQPKDWQNIQKTFVNIKIVQKVILCKIILNFLLKFIQNY